MRIFLFLRKKIWGLGVEKKDGKKMKKSINDVPFRKLPLEARIEVVKKYVLENKGGVLLSSLCDFFKCRYYDMRNVIDEAGFCLLPKSYHNVNRVLEVYRSGERDVDVIAKEVCFSRETVYNYMRKLSILKKKGDIIREKVSKAYEEGYRTCAEIGNVIGVSKYNVGYHKNKLGLPTEKKGRPIVSKRKTTKKERNDLVLSGDCSVAEIAEEEGVTRSAICAYINRNDLMKGYIKARVNKGFRVWGSRNI